MYRGYVDWREKARWLAPRQFTVYSNSIWDFDSELGFSYRPNTRVDVAVVGDGVPKLCRSVVIDQHGSPGRGIAGAKSTEAEIVVLGDSFTAMVHGNETWTDIFADLVRSEHGHAPLILNVSRDGYGVLQMFDQAAYLLRSGHRPRVFIFAIIGLDLIRPRSWKMTLERNGGHEIFVSTVPSHEVAPQTHVRAALVDPRVTQSWCETLRASGRGDEIARSISASFDTIRRSDERIFRPKMSYFDVTTCYLCNRIRYGRPTKETPANRYNPAHGLMRFQDDPRFLDSLTAIRSSGIPIWLVYLPYEPELRTGRKEFSPQERSLWQSLESVSDRVVDLTPQRSMGDAALSLTMQPEDYHPSRAGIEYYAHELARQIGRSVSDLRASSGK